MAQFYEVVTPASAEVLSLADAKAFLRVETTADDDLIEALIAAAIDSGELYTGRTFAPTTFRVSQNGGSCLRLLRAPVTSLTSVETWDAETEAFVALTGYLYYPSNFFPSVSLPASVASPTTAPFGVQAEFVAGYTDLPKTILQALKMHVNFLYENRGDAEAIGNVAMPSTVKMLYRQYRIIATYG